MKILNKIWVWVFIVILGGGVVFAQLPEPIPDLEVSKDDILYSNEYTEYEYQLDKDGKILLDENKEPIIESQKQIVAYAYKSGEEAPILENEIIEKRTENIVTRDLGGNKRSAQSGYNFYQEDGWKKVKFATTTPEVFNEVSLISRIINKVFADSEGANSPGTMADDATVGTKAWSNPDRAKVSDDSYSQAIVIQGGD